MKSIIALLLFLACVPAARAGEGWTATDIVAARLVSAVTATGDGATVPLGLHLRLQPGWKTYWRSPGDAGQPPRLDWQGSANLAAADPGWPAPHRFSLFGLETFGYDGDIVLPIEARPTEPGKPLDLKAGLDLLVCSEICVPQHLDLTLAIPAGPALPGPDAPLIARAVARIPGDGAAAGLNLAGVAVGGTDAAPVLEVTATAREPFAEPDAFIESDPPLALGAPERRFSDGNRRVTLRLPLAAAGPADAAAGPLAGRAVTVTLVDGARSLEAPARIAAAVPVSSAGELPAMLGIALLGGLLLNLMPCVLPVLSLKLLSVVGHGGGSVRQVRAGFLASAAGILASFLVLATAAVALRQAGAAVGWGIQFQHPLFLAFMAVLVTLFACNLWGLFEIPLPRVLADAVVSFEGLGHHRDRPHGGTLAGHFATGAFATLLATPCSAPFLGTAVGFALARGPLEIYAVFTALALGLGLPYLAVALRPRLATRLPRPGRWMAGLRRVLGGVLVLTGLWLLSVLAAQIDPRAAAATGALLAATALALALRRRLAERTDGTRAAVAAGVAAGLSAAAALVLPAFLPSTASPGAAAPVSDARWQPFDLQAVRDQVAAGRTVFVEVTADWCLTCQANKRLVLQRDPVAGRLFGGGIVAMKADWTRPDPAIAAYLAGFGRYGIPFNVVYGPRAPDGLPLPELLSDGAVLAALDKAAGRS